MLDKHRLTAALDPIAAALRDHPLDRMIGVALAYEAASNSERADPRVSALINAIRAEPDLAIFDGMMQMSVNAANRTEYYQLAVWLMGRASDCGSAAAVDDLDRYVTALELPCENVLVLAGIQPEATMDLGHGLSLVPWDELADSPQKQSLMERTMLSIAPNAPSAAIVRPFVIPKRHVAPGEYKMELVSIDDVLLQDALSCVSLVGPCATQFLATWVRLAEWAPAVGGGMAIPHVDGIARLRRFSADDGSQAKDLLEKFEVLPVSTQVHLRLVIQRLGQAMRRFASVDAAIDLGIALESLFLNDQGDDRGELTFRLRLRAARFLGVDIPDRKRIHGLVGQIYRVRSAAVHTGVVAPQVGSVPVRSLLDEGCALASAAVRRVIRDGMPVWDDIQFG